MTVTTKTYKSLDESYEYFNKKLFHGKLPECLITFNRKANCLGYYNHEKFKSRDGSEKISELSLNPDTFEDRSDMEVLSTLTHEMVHTFQYLIGNPPRKGYHDKGFAALMFDIGLQASSTGEEGGRTTGQRMSHYIIPGGKFEIAAGAFLANGNKLYWNSQVETKEAKEKKKTRWKYACPECLQAAWAKKSAKLMCGDCKVILVVEEDDD